MKEKNNIEIPVLTSHLNVENPNENVDSINADLHRNLSFYPKEIGIGKVNIGSLDVEGFILPNGDFVKTSELLNALENSLKQKESTQYYIRGIVKSKVDMETIINNIKAKIANMSKIVLNGDNVSTSISIRHPDLGEFDTERTFEHYVYTHHGETKQFTVPCGEYVSVEEVKKALQKYFYYDVKEKSPKTELDLNSTPIHEHDEEEFESKRKNKINNPKQERLKKIRIPKKKPDKKDDEYDEDVIEEEKREDIKENDEKIVITRIQRNLIPALATATAVIELFSFLSITPPTAEQVANYTINHQGTSYVYETDSQARNRLIGSLELGETIDLKDGLTYYESSDYDMGGKLKVDI